MSASRHEGIAAVRKRSMTVAAASERSVIFLGGTRYSCPLDEVTEKKFRTLAALGECAVIGFSTTFRPRRFHQHADFYLLPNMPLIMARYAAMLLAGPLLIAWRARRRPGVKIIVAQSPLEGFVGAIAKRICRLTGAQVALVVESHGDFDDAFFLQRSVRMEPLWRFVRRIVARAAFRQADALRAISAATRNQLERSCPGRPIVQFPAWTDIQIFLEAGERRGSLRGFTVIYAGVLSRLKQVHTVLEAVALVRKEEHEIRTVIAGSEDDGAYAAWLRTRTRELGLVECVRFTGQLTQRELARQMAAADALVLPSLSEGLGRVLLEAMACGTPVIASEIGGTPEIVRHEDTGFLVPPGDVHAIADRLLWLVRHPAEGRWMGTRGREAARALFSTDRYRKGYEHLFDLAFQTVQA